MASVIDLSSHIYPKFVPDVDNYVPVDCRFYDFNDFLPLVSVISFNVFMLNIRSCRKNFNMFLAYFSQFLAYFSCIVLTETWLTAEQDNVFTLPGFYHYNLYRDHRGGGIKIFIKNGIQAKILQDYTLLNEYFEILSVELLVNCKKIILCAIYHPPTSSHINNNAFVHSLISLLRELSRQKLPLVICGDLNLNLFNPLEYGYIENFIHDMLELNLSPAITIPTKINPENPITKFSLLDQIWVSERDSIQQSFVIPVNITDHFPVGINIDILDRQFHKASSMMRHLTERKKDTFRTLLTNFQFEVFVNDFNKTFSTYYKQLFELYERAFPVTNTAEKTEKPAPWMTDRLLLCVKKKAKLYKLYLRGKVEKADYTWYRNRLSNILRKAKRLYFAKVFLKASGNSNKIWSSINSIMERKKVISIEYIKRDGVVIVGREMANHFNRHFVTAAAFITNGLAFPTSYVFHTIPVLESCFLFPTDVFEVTKIIKSLKNKGSKLLDISILIIKDNADILSQHFAELYNTSLSEIAFPSLLKLGRITPTHKSGSKNNVDNYRPISALPVISKIFEKLTLYRMESFIDIHSILSPCQFGFRRGKSTTHAIIKLLSSVITAFHRKQYCVCFFLDLRKAFDTVNHKMLLQKLAHYGFRGQCGEYLQSYFHNRKQYVYLNGHKSDEEHVKTGVPQGSILGPVCFSLFINDLPLAVDADTILFADDAAFVISGPSLVELFYRIEKLFRDLNKYLNNNYLVANSSKCKLMMFSSRPTHHLPDLVFSGGVIDWVRDFKYLGLTITNSLSFAKHIENVTLNVSRLTGALIGIRDSVPLQILKMLYNALVLPYLTQHLIIWGAAPSYQQHCLNIRVNNMLRLIMGVRWNNGRPLVGTRELYKSLGLLKVASLYKFGIFKFLKQLLEGRYPELYDMLLRPYHSIHQYNTRGGMFRHPPLVCEVERRFLPHQMIIMYDDLPHNLLNSSLAASLRSLRLKLLEDQ